MKSAATFGPAFEEAVDGERVRTQMLRVRDFMLSSLTPEWLTMEELAAGLSRRYPSERFPVQSVDAQRRHLKKSKFGGYRCPKRRRGGESSGLWEYRLLPPVPEEFLDEQSGQGRLF